MTIKTPLLQHVGEALYGPRWQTDLANCLGVSDRTMRRWVAEPDLIPSTIWTELLRVLIDHSRAVEDVKARVMGAIAMQQPSPLRGGVQVQVPSQPRRSPRRD